MTASQNVPPVAYDDLPRAEQDALRAQWDAGFEERLANLDLVTPFEKAGQPYAEQVGEEVIVRNM